MRFWVYDETGVLLRKFAYKEEAEKFWDDGYAATRRAIVRAAAEIGKGMK